MSEEATLEEFQSEPESKLGQEWQTVKLEDVSHKRSENVDPQKVDLERHVGLKHIEPNTLYPNWESLDDLSSTKRRFEAGDILFAKLRPNLEKSAQPDFEGVASTDIFPIVAEQGVNSRYLLYRLSSKPAYDHARRTSVGTRMPRTSWNLFSNFEFGLPPLEEQRKIATVLYTVDQAIQKTEEIVSQTRTVRNGVSQRLLSRGVQDHELIQSNTRHGEIPSNWTIEKLVEVTDIIGRTEPPTDVEKYWNGNIPWAALEDIHSLDGPTISGTKKSVTQDAIEQVPSNIIPKGSVLLTTRATVGLCAVNEIELTTARAFKNLVPADRLETWYLYYRILSMENYLNRLGWGSTFTEIIKPELENVSVPIPPKEEQIEIGERLLSVDRSITKSIRFRNQLQRLKQGLMQDLLSGAVRTDDVDIAVLDDVLAHG